MRLKNSWVMSRLSSVGPANASFASSRATRLDTTNAHALRPLLRNRSWTATVYQSNRAVPHVEATSTLRGREGFVGLVPTRLRRQAASESNVAVLVERCKG